MSGLHDVRGLDLAQPAAMGLQASRRLNLRVTAEAVAATPQKVINDTKSCTGGSERTYGRLCASRNVV